MDYSSRCAAQIAGVLGYRSLPVAAVKQRSVSGWAGPIPDSGTIRLLENGVVLFATDADSDISWRNKKIEGLCTIYYYWTA
jgi:hypothetical protein